MNRRQIQVPNATGILHAEAKTFHGESKLSTFLGLRLILY
jgi:hypothetical protein